MVSLENPGPCHTALQQPWVAGVPWSSPPNHGPNQGMLSFQGQIRLKTLRVIRPYTIVCVCVCGLKNYIERSSANTGSVEC